MLSPACGRFQTISSRSATTRQKAAACSRAKQITAGTLIEAAPVIIVPAEQCALLDRTILHDYYFQWDDNFHQPGRGAVPLGLVALCNHSRRPNARVRRNPARETLDLLATAPIAAGDEVTIDYHCPLWFEPQD
jgi:uncharacterized protein